ncbi:hypothetical protein ACOME3_002174 [Neoechinorhynchus agilis]
MAEISTRIAQRVQELKQRVNSIPSGRPKSGRTWKRERSKIKKAIPGCDFKSSKRIRNEVKSVQEKQKKLEAAVVQHRKERRERREENEKRRIENERRAEVVQVIRDPAKIKKMKRKQLRQLQTRDPDKLKQAVEPIIYEDDEVVMEPDNTVP